MVLLGTHAPALYTAAVKLPLSKRDFRRAIRQGLGRAVIAVEAPGADRYRAAVDWAIVRWTGYDRQCEPGRAAYLMDVIVRTGETDHHLQTVLNALPGTKVGNDEDQLLSLLALFARRGYDAARDSLFDRLTRYAAEKEFGWLDCAIEADGLQGLLWLARAVGADIPADEPWRAESWVDLAKETEDATEVDVALAEAARNDERVQRFMRLAQESPAHREAWLRSSDAVDSSPMSFAEFEVRIGQNPRPWAKGAFGRSTASRWSREASDEDLRLAAAAFVTESNPDKLIAYGMLFSKRQFPLDPEPLVTRARTAAAAERRPFVMALTLVNHPRVRELALGLLNHGETLDGISLLESSYRSGDGSPIMTALRSLSRRDADDFHWCGFAVRDVYERQGAADGLGPLIWLYENTACSLCRGHALDLLLKADNAPDWMVQESLWDCNCYTRETARKAAGLTDQ